MRAISASELVRLKLSAVESMNDQCDRYAFSGTADSLGEISQSWDTGTFSISCGFQEVKEKRDERGELVVLSADALLTVALTQTLTLNDKIVVRGDTFLVDGINVGYTALLAELVKRHV